MQTWQTDRPNNRMTKLHEAQLFLRSWQFFSQPRHSPYFMIPEGSLPYSQQPTTHPCPQSDQSIPLALIQTLLSSILTMSSHLCLGLATALFQFSLPKPCMHFTSSPHMPHALPVSSLHDHPNNTWQAVPIIQPLTMQFPPVSFHFLPLTPKYRPQHSTLQPPQPMFFPQCKRSSFSPT